MHILFEKEYLRMRNDHKLALKKIKQQINAFCLRHGFQYSGTKWTQAHLKWIKKLEVKNMYRETLDEYTLLHMRNKNPKSKDLIHALRRLQDRKSIVKR